MLVASSAVLRDSDCTGSFFFVAALSYKQVRKFDKTYSENKSFYWLNRLHLIYCF